MILIYVGGLKIDIRMIPYVILRYVIRSLFSKQVNEWTERTRSEI